MPGQTLRHLLACLAACLLPALVAASAGAAVRVIVGPTPIVDGGARAAGDITIVNERLAFALAVDSPVPYGVPRGAIVDVAPVVAGVIGRDHVVYADFIPNDWSAWPNTYHRVSILERGPRIARVRCARDWGEVAIDTLYTLRAGSDHVEISVTMTNHGTTALPDLLSGLTLWPRGGYYFAVPGLAGTEAGDAAAALADRAVAYDEDWSIALHAPYLTDVRHGSLDLYRRHTLAPGASATFDGWLQVGASGDLGPVVRAEIGRRHLASGTIAGQVTGADGQPVERPVVVVEHAGQPYAWVLGRDGRYALDLPVGEYTLYATAKGHSQSASTAATVTAGTTRQLDFTGIGRPGTLEVDVSDGHGRPLDARLSIVAGQQPLVQFLGRRTFYTELDRPGHATLSLAPGAYTLGISSGGGFLGPDSTLDVAVRSAGSQSARVAVSRLYEPRARGWYAADLHHHSDQAEAVTPPADLARSELAAGLDVLFVSDHDSTVNHAALQRIADARGIPFMPGVELSPSWGHFNAYPLRQGEPLAIDTGTATIGQIFAEARRLGAIVVQANHPFIPYGYFASLEAGVVPGGFDPGFDLIEMNADVGDEARIYQRLWSLWNAGHRYYLSAGTDTHDVWNSVSGRLRIIARPEGAPDAASYARALKAGHAYVTAGPLVYPSVDFGDELKVRPGVPFELAFDLESVAGLQSAHLIGGGAEADSRVFTGAPQRAHVAFRVAAGRPTWYSLVVEDTAGHRAYTDPIWVDAIDGAGE